MTAGYKKIGKYDVLDVIGRGGMGVIYKAVDPGIGRVVAIKMMTAFLEDAELLQRFYREAQSVGKLQHPNIVTIYDLGAHDGNPYLVMEFLEGESLEKAIRTQRAFSLEEKLDIVVQVCDGAGYAHQRHVIHRDIKPANVMLLQDRRVKIVDFGVARVGNDGTTRPGQIMGSIHYMSPEQINVGSVDVRSDIFSIGVMLYHLLTAKLPFEGKDAGETLLKILHEPAPALKRFLTSYPPELDEIIDRVLAKNRELRFQAAEELAFELTHIQERLRRERAAGYVKAAEEALAAGQLNCAKEQLLQVLKIDRQDVRANALLRELQQRIQKQQRSERARDLRSEAEKALTRGKLAEALGHLDRAAELDQGNLEILEFRDSVRKNKERSEKLQELLHRVEMSQDAGDLDAAYQTVKEALAIDAKNMEACSLDAAISRKIAERNRQLQLQKFMREARRQISSRHFISALQLLKQAGFIDPTAPGILELINLAVSGQQQEKKRQALERLTSEIEDALDRDDYDTACARADEGLQSYPDDSGLKKLKAVAEKQHAAKEKRKYVEEKISAAQKLLEEKKSQMAIACLQEALAKYPNEMALQSMLKLVSDSLERERLEQKKAEVLQKAKDSIRRRHYKEAVLLLKAAREETPTSDFDDLLQFAEEKAAYYEKRQKIDSVAEQAHKLNSEEKYAEAIQLLDTTLHEIPDQELEIILSDIRRHVEEFNRQVQDAITNADRLLRQDRYAEAVRFLEGQPYAKSPQLRDALAAARQKRQFWHAVSLAKEEVRDAIACSELDRAEILRQKSREQLGDVLDLCLLEKEIQTKRQEIAKAKLEAALNDVRVLLQVRSFESAQSVLETVAELVVYADDGLVRQFDAFLESARTGAAQRHAQQSVGDLESTQIVDLDDQTQLADLGQLEAILGDVAVVAGHYPDDTKVQTAIEDIRNKITSRITVIRRA
jgi:serine/threonine-protein kinase